MNIEKLQNQSKTPQEGPNNQSLRDRVSDCDDQSEHMPTLKETEKYGNKVYHPRKQTPVGEYYPG